MMMAMPTPHRHALLHEEAQEESLGHIAMRQLFSKQSESIEVQRVEKKSRETIIRESANSITLKRKVGGA